MLEQRKSKSVNAIIEDMKSAVIDRCRGTIEAARKKPKEKEIIENHGVTSRLKRNRGL